MARRFVKRIKTIPAHAVVVVDFDIYPSTYNMIPKSMGGGVDRGCILAL